MLLKTEPGHWNTGTLEHRDTGTPGHRGTGTPEKGDNETMRQRENERMPKHGFGPAIQMNAAGRK